jgi:hypothetical protein
MVILNMLACISRTFVDKMDGQILAISKDVLEFESLIGSKRRSMQCDLINSKWRLKLSSALAWS